jgi:hypothetical protein
MLNLSSSQVQHNVNCFMFYQLHFQGLRVSATQQMGRNMINLPPASAILLEWLTLQS